MQFYWKWFRPNKRDLRNLILHRAVGFVKHFIFALNGLQAHGGV